MVQGHCIRVQDGVLYEKSKPNQLEPTQARTAQLESVVLSILFLPFLDKRLTTFHNVKEEEFLSIQEFERHCPAILQHTAQTLMGLDNISFSQQGKVERKNKIKSHPRGNSLLVCQKM